MPAAMQPQPRAICRAFAWTRARTRSRGDNTRAGEKAESARSGGGGDDDDDDDDDDDGERRLVSSMTVAAFNRRPLFWRAGRPLARLGQRHRRARARRTKRCDDAPSPPPSPERAAGAQCSLNKNWISEQKQSVRRVDTRGRGRARAPALTKRVARRPPRSSSARAHARSSLRHLALWRMLMCPHITT